MINMTFSQAAGLCGGRLFHTDGTASFTGAASDSRAVKEGMLFVPLIGARSDGHAFAKDVKKAGAAGMLWKKGHPGKPEDLPLIEVDDVVEAFGKIARGWLMEVDPMVVGVTGSNGKTSTKDFCASLFGTTKKTWKTQGNRNTEIGLPLTICEMPIDTEVLILEMGMENKGEIAYLCTIAPLDIAIIASIGSAHMENLGSIENIAAAKCEILSSLKPFGTLVYNAASPELVKVLADQPLDPTWQLVAFGEGTDFAPENLQMTRHGFSFTLPSLGSDTYVVRCANPVQADNATAALLAARAGEIRKDLWSKAIEETELTPMRGQIRPFGQASLFDDTYKSNPESARAALDALMQIPAKVHVAVLSDMLDLGSTEQELHRQIGEYASQLGVDRLYTWGPLSKAVHDGFDGYKVHFENKIDMIRAVRKLDQLDAAILVKGSRSMHMEDVIQGCLEGENMKKIRLGILFGGQSSEYSVSLHSAASFLRSLNTERYETTLIGISRDGKFYRYLGDASAIEHDEWMAQARPIAWVNKGIYDFETKETIDLDVCFPVLHGKNGEDGAIAGMLQMFDLPCVGCDILGAAICMDKEVMHRLCDQTGIPAAEYICINERDPLPSFDEVRAQIELPWIIKPCNAGSSYGVAFVENEDQYEKAVKDAFKYDGRGKILVEKAIQGFEIGCAVMGDQTLFAGEIDEIEMKSKVFDFEGKYAMKDSAIYCPARISHEKAEQARELAKKVFRTLCCRDMARVDMFIEDTGRILLNEVNTIPGFTDTSRYPTMMAKAGRPFTQLIDELVDLAMVKKREA